MTYCGWKNYDTWNVWLWITGDEGFYRAAVDYVENHGSQRALYKGFVSYYELEGTETPDGARWDASHLDYRALNAAMRELAK